MDIYDNVSCICSQYECLSLCMWFVTVWSFFSDHETERHVPSFPNNRGNERLVF